MLPRVLAAADTYHAMREPRPHRPVHTAEQARTKLIEEIRRGKLDGEAARAVIEAAKGSKPKTLHAWPRGLSDREVEVLRLVARGETNKEIGTTLGISSKTVQHHVAHVYEKIGVKSRAAAALFATEQGLLMME